MLQFWSGGLRDAASETRQQQLELQLAEANARAEADRLERVKLELRIAPRRLTGDLSNSFTNALAGAEKLNIVIVSRIVDAEGMRFAKDIGAAFQQAGWSTQTFHNWTESLSGLLLATVMPSHIQADLEQKLRAAFIAGGYEVEIRMIPTDKLATMSPHFQAGVLYVLVGAKP